MKNTLKRHKKLILTGLLLLLVTVGTTFAWWTALVTVNQEIKMGNLAIKASLEKLTDPIDYEPGLTTEQTGTIKNTGSIPAMIKIEDQSQIKLKGEPEYTDIADGAVNLVMKPQANSAGYWYKDAKGNTYVLLDPKEEAAIDLNSQLVGEKMGNEYMNASIKIAGKFHATQVIEGALAQEFGLDASELTDLDPSETTLSRSAQKSEALQYLETLLGRKK